MSQRTEQQSTPESSAGTSAAPAAGLHAPTHREILTIIGGLMIGMFLAALDQTVVATAIRTIGDDLHGLSLQAWVTTAYCCPRRSRRRCTASSPTSTAASRST